MAVRIVIVILFCFAAVLAAAGILATRPVPPRAAVELERVPDALSSTLGHSRRGETDLSSHFNGYTLAGMNSAEWIPTALGVDEQALRRLVRDLTTGTDPERMDALGSLFFLADLGFRSPSSSRPGPLLPIEFPRLKLGLLARETLSALEVCFGSESAEVRRHALLLLKALAPHAGEGTYLFDYALQDESSAVRLEAALCVGCGTSKAAAIPVLIRSLDSEFNARILIALRNVGPSGADALPAITRMIDSGQLAGPNLVAALLAVQSMGPAARTAKSSLTRLLMHRNPTIRVFAGYALMRAGLPLRPNLHDCARLIEDKDIAVGEKVVVVRALGAFESSEATQLLISALDAPHPELWAAVAETLSAANPHPREDGLRERLIRLTIQGPSSPAHVSLLNSLTRLGVDPEELAERIAVEAPRHHVNLLGELVATSQRARELILAAAASEDLLTRRSAARQLARFREERDLAARTLIDLCSDEDLLVRLLAVEGLGSLGSAAGAAIPKLRAIQADRTSPFGVRSAVRGTLAQLSEK